MAGRGPQQGGGAAAGELLTPEGEARASAELEAGRALDGVQQLAAQQGLVLELGQLQQVHAGAGRGQPLQVGAPVVDAEGRVQLLRDRSAGRGVSERGRAHLKPEELKVTRIRVRRRPGGHAHTLTEQRHRVRAGGATGAPPCPALTDFQCPAASPA